MNEYKKERTVVAPQGNNQGKGEKKSGAAPPHPAFEKKPVEYVTLEKFIFNGMTKKEREFDDYVKKNSKHLGISEEQFIKMVTPPKRRPQ